MNNGIDQGTIIYGIRSFKYPEIPCYAIIITARCDISQCKVPKYYYLVAVDAAAWFSTKHGFEQTFSQIIKNHKNNIIKKANDLNLNGESLILFTQEEQNAVISHYEKTAIGNKELRKNIGNLKKDMKKYNDLISAVGNREKMCEVLKRDMKTATNYLKDIDSGKLMHYYFLPQISYLENGKKNKGLIVDLLEIGILSLKDAKTLSSPFSQVISFNDLPAIPSKDDISYMKNEDIPTLVKTITKYFSMKSQFWLNNETDFVAIEGTTKSPWCEHLMQRFSNAFARIGLDNPTDTDFRNIIEDSCKGIL